MKKKVFVIVAHPDDEIIWMGGTLLKNKNNWDITIICLCRKNDSDRNLRFRKSCNMLKAKGFISDLEDETLEDIPLEEVIKRIKAFIPKNKKYDYVFTHGFNGEYGHKRHIDVHKAVKKMLDDKTISGNKVLFFSYIKKRGFCHSNKNSNKFININNIDLLIKKRIIQNIYGFKKDSFENKCCRNVETFKTEKIK